MGHTKNHLRNCLDPSGITWSRLTLCAATCLHLRMERCHISEFFVIFPPFAILPGMDCPGMSWIAGGKSHEELKCILIVIRLMGIFFVCHCFCCYCLRILFLCFRYGPMLQLSPTSLGRNCFSDKVTFYSVLLFVVLRC